MSVNLTQPAPFWQQLTPELLVGSPAPSGWKSIATQPLLIVVGLTGSGKSTTTAVLMEHSSNVKLLPNRRTLTDKLIIPTMAKVNGGEANSSCRIERLKYTRQYRQQFPGGMAHILTQLQVKETGSLLIFDGLRGENEVSYAATALPNAKFIVLEASEKARLLRLLTRNDSFDKIALGEPDIAKAEEDTKLCSFASLGIPEASEIFSLTEERQLFALARKGMFSCQDLQSKLKIVVSERYNYDPVATRSALLAKARDRTFVFDTTTYGLQQIAENTIARFKEEDAFPMPKFQIKQKRTIWGGSQV